MPQDAAVDASLEHPNGHDADRVLPPVATGRRDCNLVATGAAKVINIRFVL